MKYLIRFDDEDALDPQVVGQKFHALAKAARGGFAVPRAVAVSTSAHRYYLLIAKNTDPGWTPILSIVGGMVMEEGGLLNHCSIVARELGVPSIVGVPAATRRIRNDDLITMDGGLGIIVVEE